ncbi:hypothetical protein SODALDRAFT_62412 [Sodiomyces alkalinus F11]|uniref:Uncharacterized protein n=1 Tax=Sodiomyces alkalinus (strain CBS 110278 / VKM F-3762 / F11) TaxID=1314773 RepID=A0A3N2PLD4_SODAK|nr:hypothetical protein SODALDRAFT_62412 [Sodiomyces alkalinus F11]ROT35332.1 hypothetical protein SODALDRAFT_62412 [Sodiomyces alkalinus F11]
MYKAIYDALKETQDPGLGWSDRTQWKHFSDSAISGRKKRTLDLVLSSIGFAKWHRSQTELLDSSPKSAAEQVNGDFLKMCRDNAAEQTMSRRSLNTNLARGRKWVISLTSLDMAFSL